jgi:hypothetical protein
MRIRPEPRLLSHEPFGGMDLITPQTAENMYNFLVSYGRIPPPPPTPEIFELVDQVNPIWSLSQGQITGNQTYSTTFTQFSPTDRSFCYGYQLRVAWTSISGRWPFRTGFSPSITLRIDDNTNVVNFPAPSTTVSMQTQVAYVIVVYVLTEAQGSNLNATVGVFRWSENSTPLPTTPTVQSVQGAISHGSTGGAGFGTVSDDWATPDLETMTCGLFANIAYMKPINT